MILNATGAEWQRTIIAECKRGPRGSVDKASCKFLTLQEYETKGSPPDSDTVVYIKQTKNELWPNAWRGYMAASDPETRFPNFGGTQTQTLVGLNEAEPGDVVLLPDGPRGPAVKSGLAKLALVAEVRLPKNSKCDTEKNCFVKVLEPDGGKWPDICGTTDTWGEMKARYWFKKGHLPKEAVYEYSAKRINTASHCGETKISHCEQQGWDDLELYRIREDERSGCDKATTKECAKD